MLAVDDVKIRLASRSLEVLEGGLKTKQYARLGAFFRLELAGLGFGLNCVQRAKTFRS